ncbi:glutathione S-transferase F13-like [Magnolia sinica]|uniref:glutathione S-transferase F13-like n=1 Tax=Magnolia sinica TaxID=86752 RepID=UPI00265B1292|nr:glutathione S-transferase F13-like [Magnolia sinica]
MELKLYGAPMSTCVARVLACLYEMGADFELVPVNVPAGEHKQPSYLATKNPFGQIPAPIDGDLTLLESRAINRYIVIKNKGTGPDLLRLDNLKESALIGVWMEVESQMFNQPIWAIVHQIIIGPFFGGTTDDQVVEANAEKLAKVLDVYDERLSKSKYLAGDFYSLADPHHILYTHYLMKTAKALLINSRSHVKAWWDDISSRPATKKVREGMSFGGNA